MVSISKINIDKHAYSTSTESGFIEIQAANVNVLLMLCHKTYLTTPVCLETF